MNIERKLVDLYEESVKSYYQLLYPDDPESQDDAYECETDHRYIEQMREELDSRNATGKLDRKDRMFLIRNVFSKYCDKVTLRKITDLSLSPDYEMRMLADALISEILKTQLNEQDEEEESYAGCQNL